MDFFHHQCSVPAHRLSLQEAEQQSPWLPSLQGWKNALYFSRDRRRCSKMTECRSPPLCLVYIRVPVTQEFSFRSITGAGFLMSHFQTTSRGWATLLRLSRERIHAPGNGRCWLGKDFIMTRGIVLAKISFKNNKLYSNGNSLLQWNSLQLTLSMLDGCTITHFKTYFLHRKLCWPLRMLLALQSEFLIPQEFHRIAAILVRDFSLPLSRGSSAAVAPAPRCGWGAGPGRACRVRRSPEGGSPASPREGMRFAGPGPAPALRF